jgi:hypothetical protein|tara:strand:+ start:2389 stop:3249 length:861 start_codon:yes stop_codon:yes gene_type:complete
MVDTVGQFDVRGENISKVVKVFAQKKFKLKPLLTNVSSNKWTETYYKEDPTILTAGGTRNIKEIGRLSAFPSVERSWTKVSAQHFKYGDQGVISMEDVLTDAINVQARTINGIVESIVNSVDAAIYAALTAESSTSGTVAAAANWDAAAESTRKPISDILKGIQAMIENNYDALEGGMLLLSPHDYRALMENSKVINNPSFKTADVVSNGRVGQIAGLTIVVSTTVTADEAMIIINQRTATWQSVVGLTTAIIKDEGRSTIIRSWEIGQIQITDPKAIYTITNTQA